MIKEASEENSCWNNFYSQIMSKFGAKAPRDYSLLPRDYDHLGHFGKRFDLAKLHAFAQKAGIDINAELTAIIKQNAALVIAFIELLIHKQTELGLKLNEDGFIMQFASGKELQYAKLNDGRKVYQYSTAPQGAGERIQAIVSLDGSQRIVMDNASLNDTSSIKAMFSDEGLFTKLSINP